jgi:4-amino-4-deoxy-L-arabinose transferase-like glycosyltransferase
MATMQAGVGRERWTVAGVLAAGFALRMYFLLLPVSHDDDTLAYAELARNWFHHGIYGFLQGGMIAPTLIRLPGYPLFLGVVFSIFGNHLGAALVIQALADLAGCWILYDCLRTEVSRRAGWAALLLAAFCPFTAAYTATGMTESLSVFCVAAAIGAGVRLVRAGREGRTAVGAMVALAAALGYAMLLRPDGVLLTAAFCAGLVWYLRGSLGMGRALRVGMATGLLAMLPLAPWAIRNFRTFGVVQPLAPRYVNNPGEYVASGFGRWARTWSVNYIDTGTVVWNLSDQIDMDDIPARACYTNAECQRTEELIDQHDAVKGVPAALDAQFAALAGQRIRERPWNYYVVFPAERVASMWLWPRTEMLNMSIYWWRVREHPRESAIAIGLGLVNLGYLVLAAIGFARRRVPVQELLLGYIALRCVLLATLENPEQRYTMVAFPILIVAGACALAGRWDAASSGDAGVGSGRLTGLRGG